MRSARLLACLCAVVVLFATCAFAQYTVTSIAGGGPNNLPAQQSSIGFASGIAFDTLGNAYIADSYSNRVLEVSTTGVVTIVAGNGSTGYSGDGGPATSAALGVGPMSVSVDGSGNIFIADTGNNVIREVVAATGNIQTVVGNGTSGYSGDNGLATNAQLNGPFGVFVDSHGNIFVADTGNSVIREVVAGNIQTVAGNGTAGHSGDGAAATSAKLDSPQGVFADGTGNIFIADTLNSVIREVTVADGHIQTVAGSYYAFNGCNYSGDGAAATTAQLCLPAGVYVDGFGDIFIADLENSLVRVANTGAQPVTIAGVTIGAGHIDRIAGTPDSTGFSGDGGAATSAQLTFPGGVTLDGAGNIFIADTNNYVIREVSNSTGIIQTLAGNHTLGFSGDGSPATTAELRRPGATAIDGSGNIYIADSYNSVIRVLNPGAQAVTVAGVTIQPGAIERVAGSGIACAVPAPGGCGDGGPATSAQLNFPQGVFLDATGNIYIADTGILATDNSAIRVVNPGAAPITIAGTTIQPGAIATVAGTLGSGGFSGDGGAPTSAQLFNPQSVALDTLGNIYIADTVNSAVRVVNTGAQALVIGGVTVQPNTIQTIAGTPPTACADSSSGCGDNGAAASAALKFPTGLSLDGAGDIFIADSSNSVVRAVNPSAALAVTIAGVTIQSGNIATVAGTMGRDGYSGDDGPPTSAFLNVPFGVSVDSLGNIFIADTLNSVIREVVGVSSRIETVAGNGLPGFSGDGGSSAGAELNGPQNVVLGAGGSLLVADSQNSRIRKLVSSVGVAVAPASTTLTLGGTQQFAATVTGASVIDVTWQVNGVTGGNATVGTITAGGLYQAPAADPGSAITVTAISNANGTTSGSAAVTLAAAGAPAISVSTNPSGVTVVYTSTTQAFIATVTGETNTAMSWKVNGTAGGNATVGTIDATGLYTAPAAVPSPAQVMIMAVSQADATVTASYPISIVTAPSAPQPAPQTIPAGGTANFSMSLNANTGNPHNAITLSCQQSSLPSGATCTFTPAVITPSSSAVSFGLAIRVPSSSSSLRTRSTGWLATEMYFALGPLVGILLIGGNRRRRLGLIALSVMLATLLACGGSSTPQQTRNPVTYNVQVVGTSAGQPNPVPITIVKLTVQ